MKISGFKSLPDVTKNCSVSLFVARSVVYRCSMLLTTGHACPLFKCYESQFNAT